MADVNKFKAKLDILKQFGEGLISEDAAIKLYEEVCAKTLDVEIYSLGEMEKVLFKRELQNIVKTLEYHENDDDSYYDDSYDSSYDD